MPTPRRTRPSSALARAASSSARRQRGAERLKAGREAGAGLQHLAGRGGVAGAERVLEAELQPVHAEPVREVVHQRFVGDGGLRHAEAAESTGGWPVGVKGPAPRGDVRHGVRARGVNRHAARHRRSPGGVGAGIESGVERHRLQRAFGIAAHARLDRRGMALGACHHALGPLVDAGDRRVREPGGERRERLDRDIELAAEAAAAGARHDPHLRWREAQYLGRHVAVRHRRLGRDEELHPVVHTPRPAGLGLDVGVLHEGGLEAPVRRHRAVRERPLSVAALDPAFDELVALGLLVDQAGIRRAGLVEAAHRRKRLVADRKILVADGRHGRARAHQRHYRVSPVAHDSLGQHRLVPQVGVDADAVRRHV